MDKILNSFKIHNTLSPDFWDNVDTNDISRIKLKGEIRRMLLHVANFFIETLDLEIFHAEDILLTGSIANFNWSKYSDLDIHVLTDTAKIDCNQDIIKGFFIAKADKFNDKIDEAKINGCDIELYVQDIKEEHASSGVYSILHNKWIVEPNKEKFEIDLTSVDKKKNKFINSIDIIEKKSKNQNTSPEDIIKDIDSLKEKIKKYRQSGLTSDGESSDENIVFKYLRRSGDLERLSKIKTELLNKALTIDV